MQRAMLSRAASTLRPHPAPLIRHTAPQSTAFSIEWLITALLLLATVLMGTVSSSLLAHFKIHYSTLGGAFYEKLHPATYVMLLALFLSLVRNSDPIAEIDRFFGRANLVLIYLICVLLLLAQALALARPFAVVMDTFLLPLLVVIIAWQTPARHLRVVAWAIHAVVLVNVCLGYYEYFSGHRLVPLMVGDVVLTGEWRSTALLGHPLAASGWIGAYTVALILRPDLIPNPVIRLPFTLLCLGSLAVFGGRTSMVLVFTIIFGVGIARGAALIRGARIPIPVIIISFAAVFLTLAIALTAFEYGLFDKMLMRFGSDKGSAATRLATFKLLSFFGWTELIIGPDPARSRSLQSMMGLDYGIENFWVASIVQYGIASTTMITVGLICFFTELLRRSRPAAWAIVFFVSVMAAASVSFSSKNTYLAQYVSFIAILLPRQTRDNATARFRRSGLRVPAYTH